MQPRGLALALLLGASGSAQENVLVLVADDVGVDRVGAYREHPDPGRTPGVDRLAERGVLFRNAWAAPKCSPTRASALSGRFGFRTGVGEAITSGLAGLSTGEVILPEVLARAPPGPYRSAVLGKWHLAGSGQGPDHPRASGFDLHAGALANLGDYYGWSKAINGTQHPWCRYATTDTADDALRVARRLPEPWFLWVAFNASHKPFHAPPAHLHGYALSGPPNATPVEHMKAMTEALDTEIGRLLAGIPSEVLDRTTVIFLGDNGTLGEAMDCPFPTDHGKGTLYEGGVNVPLIVAGPRVRVPGSECDALVCATDLFATISRIGGVDPAAAVPPGTELDSVSLLPYLRDPDLPSIRQWAYSERFFPNGTGGHVFHNRAIRGPRYKLIRWEIAGQAPEESFFDLEADPFEQVDLLEQELTSEEQQALRRLRSRLAALIGG